MQKGWSEDEFEHLFWYLTAEERPVGDLETQLGQAFSPSALYESHLGSSDFNFAPPSRAEAAPAAVAAVTPPGAAAVGAAVGPTATLEAPAGAALSAPVSEAKPQAAEAAEPQPQEADGRPALTVKLEVLISFLEQEVADKEFRQRADAFGSGDDSTLYGHALEGQEALDAYVSQLVTIIRDFPYDRLEGGREAGAWVRDEVVAPNFRGRWNFYSNKKHGAGFDLKALDSMLTGQNMLLDKLRYARLSASL